MMDEEIRQVVSEVREMKQMCGNINMKLTNIVTQRGQDIKKKLEAEYYRGLEEGYERGLAEGKKAFDLLDAERDAEYQRGLDDAWEAAKKIVLDTNHGGIALSDLSKIFGGQSYTYIMNKNTAQEAIAKLKAYEEKQKADEEIKVGDEVERFVYGRAEGKGIYLEDADEEGNWLKCLFWTGATFTVLAYPKEQFKKTGRHFDIASILKEMQS